MEQNEIIRMITFLSDQYFDFMKERENGVSMIIRKICLVVEDNPGCSQEQAAKLLSMDKSLLARNVHRAQSEGYLRREASPVDSRKCELYIIKRGKKLNEKTRHSQNEWNKRVFAKLSTSERRQLEYLLERSCSFLK